MAGTIGPCAPLWRSFIDEVNERRLSVLEIGARTGMQDSLRRHFPNAGEYVGLDINEGPGVDLVGDVHELSSLVQGRRFGAIHSTSVFEHLAMPWVAALECMKVLEVGGVMFQHFPFGWPEHEAVDAWRFSRQSFEFLFPRAFGAEVEAVGADHPLHMHMVEPPPGQERFHENLTYAYFGALIRKTHDVDLSAFKWPLSPADILGGRRY